MLLWELCIFIQGRRISLRIRCLKPEFLRSLVGFPIQARSVGSPNIDTIDHLRELQTTCSFNSGRQYLFVIKELSILTQRGFVHCVLVCKIPGSTRSLTRDAARSLLIVKSYYQIVDCQRELWPV